MKGKHWTGFVVALMLIGAIMTACVAPPAPATAPAEEPAPAVEPAAPAAPAEEKEFVFGRYQDAIVPDPIMNDANRDIWYMQQYYGGLLRFNADMELEGDLAERWEVSDDGLTYTFYLRPDLKFADGTPITPEDWLWSLDRARNPDNGIWWFTLEAVDTFEATPEKVVFNLKEPYVPFIYSPALFNAVVMPKAQVEAAGGWEAFMNSPIGAGPYIMTEWARGDVMTLERNPHYWEAGKPVIDKITLRTITDDNTRILALQSGTIDAMNFIPKNRVAELEADPNIEVLSFPSTTTYYMITNMREEPLNDKRVRQALSHAIDRELLIKSVNFGIGEPAVSFRPRGSLYFNDTLEGWPYDLDKAKALLADAGYADGIDVVVQVLSGSEMELQVATVIKDMWAKLGVDLEVEQLEGGLWSASYAENKYQMQINYWTDDIPDPSQETNYAAVFATAESFHTGFQSDEVDQLASDALKETDPEKRKMMYYRIQEIFNEETPMIPLWYEPLVVAVRKDVQNFVQTPLGTYLWRDLDIAR